MVDTETAEAPATDTAAEQEEEGEGVEQTLAADVAPVEEQAVEAPVEDALAPDAPDASVE